MQEKYEKLRKQSLTRRKHERRHGWARYRTQKRRRWWQSLKCGTGAAAAGGIRV